MIQLQLSRYALIFVEDMDWLELRVCGGYGFGG